MQPALAEKVGAQEGPQAEQQVVGTCSPGVFLAKGPDGKHCEVEVIWRPDGKKRKLHVFFEGVKGAEDQFIPVEESGFDFLARISGIRPNHYEMLPD